MPADRPATRRLTPAGTLRLAEGLRTFAVRTPLLSLTLAEGPGAEARLRRSPGRVELTLPCGFDFADARRQAWLSRVLVEQLRRQAQAALPPRLDATARLHHLRYRRVFVKNVISRWGSCSAEGNINLSLWLMTAPVRLIDYVVCHELAHLDEMNHGPRFWARLDALTDGRARALEREMRAFGRAHASLMRLMWYAAKAR